MSEADRREPRENGARLMIRMRGAPVSIRFAAAAMLALLLAIRSLAPAGFMPAFDNGSVTIVVCPDAMPGQASHHRSGDHKSLHQPCPYAAASAVDAVGPGWTPLLPILSFGVVLLLGRTLQFIERHETRERPPLRGPPLPA